MAPMKNSHVLAALLLIACIGHDAVGAIIPATPDASLQLQCGIPALSRSKPANIAEMQGRSRGRTGPVVSASGVTVWANVRADSNAAFMISLGVIRNSSGGLLSSMLLANQCSVVVTTPLAACNVSLAGVTGTLSAPVQVLGDDVLSSDIGVTGFVAGRFSFVDI
ncbi:unnamed protein product [Miscanthus lutarioriparius]|uniref:Uncharacterized protein n=1 Tax=Miscanthus lutarioriparius TaxID=422564 RepID=A0A811Q8J9_9POAL|nr:unnamed protein product [Miscanthus lutarioriparius]